MARTGRLLALLCAVSGSALHAKLVEPPRAQLSPSQVRVGERASLVVSVGTDGDGQDLPWPEIPTAPGLAVVDKSRNQSTSEQISIVNFKMERKRVVTVQFQFQLAAQKPGNYSVGPIAYQGYELGRGQVAVVDAPQDVRIATLVAKRTVYVGQQIPFTWRLSADRPFEVLKFPDVRTALGSGFYSESPDSQQLRMKVVDEGGKRTGRLDLTGSLFPLRPGNQTIPSTSLDYRIVERVGGNIDPMEAMLSGQDPFDAMMGRTRVVQGTARTQEVQVEIKSVPDKNRPAAFQGGVGTFRLEAKLEKNKLRAGDGTTLTMTFEGTGQPQASGLPVWTAPTGVETYPPQDEWSRSWKDGILWTRLVRKIVLVPRSAGSIQLDSVRFAWFDPSAAKFGSTAIFLPTLSVEPSRDAVARDSSVRAQGPGLSKSDRFWIRFGKLSAAVWCLLLLAALGYGTFAWIRIRMSREHAIRRELAQLDKRLRALPSNRPAHKLAADLERILASGLAARLGEEARSWTSGEIPPRLVERLNWGLKDAAAVGDLSAALQAAQFAGSPLPDDSRNRLGRILKGLRPQKARR